jgi:periplasmic protein TonB
MGAATMALPVSFRRPVLPWAAAADDERRFRRILQRVLGAALLAAALLPWLPTPAPEPVSAPAPALPSARLRLDPLPKSVPPPAPAAPAERAPARTETLAPKAAQPEPRQAPVPEARQPVPGRPPGEASARRKASGMGLLAMKNELAELTGAPVAVQLRQDLKPGAGVGTGSGPGVGAGTESGVPVRAMITAAAGRGSGGLDTTGYSRDTGGGGLAGRATTLVEGVAGGGGGGGPGGGGGSARGGGSAAGGTLHHGGGGKASRSIEEIKLVFERNKGAIYALYNRALRDDPTLQGKVVLELKIAPSGAVESCRLLSSELKADALEHKLLARVRQFDFGAKDVATMVVSWPVDFLPS